MKKRAYKRTSVNVPVSFFCDNEEYTGTMKNLSNNGIYIETELCPALKSILRAVIPAKIIIHIPSRNGVVEVPVKVRRLAKTDGNYVGIGVELANPQENFLAFVDSISRS